MPHSVPLLVAVATDASLLNAAVKSGRSPLYINLFIEPFKCPSWEDSVHDNCGLGSSPFWARLPVESFHNRTHFEALSDRKTGYVSNILLVLGPHLPLLAQAGPSK